MITMFNFILNIVIEILISRYKPLKKNSVLVGYGVILLTILYLILVLVLLIKIDYIALLMIVELEYALKFS